MNDIRILKLVEQFRIAIENTRDAGLFVGDPFENFPNGCCGDSSYLLAEFLRSKGLESIYVWGADQTYQTHAWLVIKDERINIPAPSYLELPDNIRNVLNSYSDGAYSTPVDVSHYTESDVDGGLIVDITADQFGESPVYVEYVCDFYRRFEFQSANDYTGLGSYRLRHIYQKILRYLD